MKNTKQNFISLFNAAFNSMVKTAEVNYGKKLLIFSVSLTCIFLIPSPESLYAQFADGNGTSGNPYQITNATHLQNMKDHLSSHFRIMNDIDATIITNFEPVGTFENPFTGTLNGNNKKITGLTINRPSTFRVGLFGYISGSGSQVKDLGLENVNVLGEQHIGGLAGTIAQGSITNCYSTGNVSGIHSVGGLAGLNSSGTISGCYSTVNVKGLSSIGGLVGWNIGSIINSYAAGNITPKEGSASSTPAFGGLAGLNGTAGSNHGTITRCYASGNVESYPAILGRTPHSGGLTGRNHGSISDCYATGNVTVNDGAIRKGGLVGYNENGTISTSYASGNVTGSSNNFGGLVGQNNGGSISNSYWNTITTGQSLSAGGTGLSDNVFRQQSSFSGFDFSSSWKVFQNVSYPYLQANSQFPAPGLLFDGGDGSGDFPFQISNSTQLQLMKEILNGNYILLNDIDVSDIINFIPVGTNSLPFTGTFNGDGFKITGLRITRSNTDHIGLFGRISGASITNVALENVNITGRSNTGTISGSIFNSSVSGCYATGSVTGSSQVGGLVGSVSSGGTQTISNCFSTANVTGSSSNVGGLIGINTRPVSGSYSIGNVTSPGSATGGLIGSNSGTSAVISNCYAIVNLNVGNSAFSSGGLIGSNGSAFFSGGSVSNCYAAGSISGSGVIGGLIGSNYEASITNSYWNTESTGHAASDGGTGLTDNQFRQQSSFTGFDFTNTWKIVQSASYPFLRNNEQSPSPGFLYAGGAGTAEDPFQVSNLTQLQSVGKSLNSSFILLNDIDASVIENFEPIGTFANPFTGKLNGNGFKITGLKINRPDTDYIGLFSRISSGGTVTNLGLVEVNITGKNYVGGLAGVTIHTITKIENCYIKGLVTGSENVGGLAGTLVATVSNCFTSVVCSGVWLVGGIAGQIGDGTISKSYSTGNVSGSFRIGGFAGSINNSSVAISNSYSVSNVSGSDRVGGFAGINIQGILTNCYSAGKVTGSTNTGGFIGQKSGGSEESCFWNITTSTRENGFGTGTSSGVTGFSDIHFRQQSTFTGFDFNNVWQIDEIYSYSFLHDNPQSPPPGFGNEISITSSANLPAGTINNLTISGEGTVVTLVGDIVISGTLTLTEGNLAINENTLTLEGTVNFSGGRMTGSTNSNLVITETAVVSGELVFDNSSEETRSLNNLSVACDVTLGSRLNVMNEMTVSDGEFTIGPNQLRLYGDLNVTGEGNLIGGNGTRIWVDGQDADALQLPAIDLNMLDIYRPNGIVLGGPVNISSRIVLGQGVVVNASNITLAPNQRIVVFDGSFDSAPVLNNPDLAYYEGVSGTANSTGNELPVFPATINRLYVYNPNGVILNTSINSMASIVLDGGDIDINGMTINLGTKNAILRENNGYSVVGTSGQIIINRVINNVVDFDYHNIGLRLTIPANFKNTEIIRGFTPFTINDDPGIFRYYEINPSAKTTNRNLNATLVFSYDPDDLNGNIENTLELYSRKTATSPWILMSNQVLNTVTKTITVTGVDTIPQFITAKGIQEEGDNPMISGNGEQLTNTELIPEEYSLSQNYPNPFNPTTTIKYQMPENGNVTLKVFDMTGREVMNLVNGFKNAGYHTAQFNGSNLASGVYFYRLDIRGETQEFSRIMRMMLIK